MPHTALRTLLGSCLILFAVATFAKPHTFPAASLDSAVWVDPASPPASLRIQALSLGADEPPVDLLLERSHPFASNSKLRMDGQWVGALQTERTYYRGSIVGEPWSIASVSVGDNGDMRGLLSSHGGYWRLRTESSAENDSNARSRLLAQFESDAPEARKAGSHEHAGFQCGVDEHIVNVSQSLLDSDPHHMPIDEFPAALPGTDRYRVRIAFESDHSFYQLFAGDADPSAAAQEYLGDLMNYISGIYVNDLNTEMVISSISLWSSAAAEPWQELGNARCLLNEMGLYWNDPNNNVDSTRTLAHFVAGNSTAEGGVAWLSVLCHWNFNSPTGSGCNTFSGMQLAGGDYGVSGGLTRAFDPDSPQPSIWDFFVVAHELGHNFGSDHTHCYNDQIDECSAQEGGSGCFDGTPSLPGPAGEGSGTIMSYCHMLTGSYSNIAPSLGFEHPFGTDPDRVPQTMRNKVVGRANSGGARCPVLVTETGSFTVSTSTTGPGSLSPANRTVDEGETSTFTVEANTGAVVDEVTGCGGSLNGSIYTTGAIISACTVSASFSLQEYTVSTSVSGPGQIDPISASVTHGNTTSFTLTPNAGAGIVSVNGCDGSLSDNTYTIGLGTEDCTVQAQFGTVTGAIFADRFEQP